MSRSLVSMVVLSLFGCTHHHASAEPPAPHQHEPPGASSAAPDGVNPVQHEMRLLLAAVQQAVEGVALGDVRGVPEAFHRVHAAKQGTAAALASGAWRPVQGDVPHFEALDEAFHATLEPLVEASARNDVPATADALAEVVRQCDGCHRAFRVAK